MKQKQASTLFKCITKTTAYEAKAWREDPGENKS